MNARQSHQHHVDHQASKEALRAHVDQLPPEKQYEFVLTALQLISDRSTPIRIEVPIGYHPSLQLKKHAATH